VLHEGLLGRARSGDEDRRHVVERCNDAVEERSVVTGVT
jgi:hypothetical protein